MTRTCGTIILASMLMVFTVYAGEITVQRNVESVELQVIDGFHHFIKTSGPLYAEPGSPELPHIGHQLLLPPGEEIISIKLENAVWETIPGQFNLWHAQAPIPYSRIGEQPPTPRNQAIYESDDLFPQSALEMSRTDFMNGHSIGSISITAARYQPASGILEVLTSYDLIVETAASARAQQALNQMLKQNQRTIDRIERQVENPEYLAAYPVLDETDEVGVKYLIVTTDDFVAALQMLIEHRTNRGLQTEIVLMDDIESSYPGIDTSDKIRNCVLDYYINYALEYVLLCGDVEHVPTRGLYAAIGGEQDDDIAADVYFSNLDGNWNSDGDNLWGEPGEGDLYSEVAIGRFAVDDIGEAYSMIYKTIYYENTPVEADIEKALMMGEDLGWVAWGGDHKEEIRLGSSNFGYTTAGFPGNFTVDVLYDMYTPWSAMSNLLPLLNNGINLGNHLGHCNVSWTMKFSTSQVNSFNMTNNGINHNFYILYSQGCYGGSFDNRTTNGSYTSDCICEAFTTIQNSAVAFLCNSRYGWGSGNNTNGPSQYYDRQFFDALFAENISNIGWTNADSKEDCVPYISAATLWVFYEMNLLGDPALDIWTAQPQLFSPTFPDTVILGTSQIQIDVGESGAHVSLADGNIIIGSALSNPSGIATIFLSEPIAIPGELTLSITAHNYYLYQGSIYAIAAEGPFIMMSDAEFDDTAGGNGDGNPDLGETLLFSAEFENVGIEDATGLTAVIECEESCIDILQADAVLGDLLIGESIQLTDAFEVSILPTVFDGQEIEFIITVTDDQEGAWTCEHVITAFAPSLQLISYTLDDGNDGRLIPGETATLDIELYNDGGGTTTDLTITIYTDNPLATVNTPANMLTALASGETGNISDIEFVVDAAINDPSALVLYLNAVDTRLYQQNFIIEIPVGGVFDDMEAGVGEWTHEAVTVGWNDQWNHAQFMNHTPGGSSAWYCGDNGQYMELLDAGLLSPIYQVYGKHQLRFYHWMSAQLASTYPGYCYDGGIVELSLNGAPFEQITPDGGYPLLFKNGVYPGPLPEDTPCYSGQILWNEAVFDIVGEGTAQFRFRFISDGSMNSVGWFIDDLELLMESTPNAPTDLSAEQVDDNILLTWCTPGLGSQLDGIGKSGDRNTESLENYHIYRDGALIAETAALSYTDNLSGLVYGSYVYQVAGVFDGVEGSLSEPFAIDYVGIRPDSETQIPSETELRSAYPNPFNPVITLNFDLAQADVISMTVYDLMGRTIATILDTQLAAGSHTVQWDASQFASGMYLVQMKSGTYTGIQKVLLLK